MRFRATSGLITLAACYNFRYNYSWVLTERNQGEKFWELARDAYVLSPT